MRRLLLFGLPLAAGAAIFFFAVRQRSTPPEIPFARAALEDIVSTLSTNGKVQPFEWSEIHSETAGAVSRTLVTKGQEIAAGAALVELAARAAQSDLSAANARAAQAQAELQSLEQGGRTSDISTLESSLATARQELDVAQRELASLERMSAKQAATAEEVRAGRDRVERARAQIAGLENRRGSLVGRTDVAAARARLQEAEAAVGSARSRIGLATVRSPIAGTVYQFNLRPGGYLNAGDLVATVGKLDRVRVLVYVDEPDLGRVEAGKPVTITWDAMPGRVWKGVVERMPTEVTALGTRQVGEVSLVIGNPDRDLLPGTNVNVEIRAQAVKGAVVIPTAAIRRENGRTGVYVLAGDAIRWREVRTGVSSAARSQVDGLQAGDSVALPTERALKNGMRVQPVY